MLQKLLIASIAAIMLSACSGSDSTSSETVNDPPPAPDPSNPQEPEEPTGPVVLASLNFGAETSVDSWQARCADGGSCGADLSHSADEGVLVVSPAWVTASDNLEVYTALDPEIADLAFADVEIDIRVTEEYLTDGNLQMQVFFENAAGGIAYTGWTAPQTEYENEAGEMVSSNGWTQLEFDTIEMSSFSYASDAFALQNVNAMGVQFVSNGKPASVGGDFWIDNVRITAASDADKPKTSITAPLTEGWRLNDEGGTMEYTDTGVTWTPENIDGQLLYDISGPQNLDGATFSIEIVVDQAFIDGEAELLPFIQRTDDYSIGFYGCGNIVPADLVAGEAFTKECGPLSGDYDLSADMAVQVGFLAKAATAGTVTVTDLTVDLAEGVYVIEPPKTTNVINIPVASGWYVNDDVAPMSFTDEGAQFNPTAGDQQFVYDIAGPVDLGGASVEMEFTVDADLIASGASLQPFAQQITGEGSLAHWGCWVDISALVEGENTATCVLPDEFELVDEESAVKIGFQTKNGGAGTIVVTDMTITLAEGITVPSDQYGEPAAPVDEPAANEQVVAVDADWQNDGSPATISYDNGVVITPDWTGQQVAFVVLDEAVDMTGATVTYVIDVPEAYVTDGGMVIQPFSQQNADPYAAISDGAIPGGWNPTGGLEAGENTIVHGPFDAPPADIQRVGVWLNEGDKADGVTGDVIIRSITITFPE